MRSTCPSDLTALQAGAYLHHLHLSSPDPDRLAAFYADVMDMRAARERDHWRLHGRGRRLLISEGAAQRLVSAGFAVRDREGLERLEARVRRLGTEIRPHATPLFEPGAFAVTDPDEHPIAFGLTAVGTEPESAGLRGPLQHLTLATLDPVALEGFYVGVLGFGLVDRVVNEAGQVMTVFMRGNHEHHNIACFRYRDRQGIDHHSYEAGEWDTIRDWADRFAARGIPIMWGPGRHGPGNNLFIFIEDPDRNWIEVSAELEVIHDRAVKQWPHEERTLNLWGRAIMRA